MEEVIGRANKNNYGLAAAVFTKDVSNALFMSNRWKDGAPVTMMNMMLVLVLVLVVIILMIVLLMHLQIGDASAIPMHCSSRMGQLDDTQ